MLAQLALEGLQDYVQDSVGIQVEVSDDALDDLEYLGRADGAQILVELSDQLRVAFAFLPEQVELLLLVAARKEKKQKKTILKKKSQH